MGRTVNGAACEATPAHCSTRLVRHPRTMRCAASCVAAGGKGHGRGGLDHTQGHRPAGRRQGMITRTSGQRRSTAEGGLFPRQTDTTRPACLCELESSRRLTETQRQSRLSVKKQRDRQSQLRLVGYVVCRWLVVQRTGTSNGKAVRRATQQQQCSIVRSLTTLATHSHTRHTHAHTRRCTAAVTPPLSWCVVAHPLCADAQSAHGPPLRYRPLFATRQPCHSCAALEAAPSQVRRDNAFCSGRE